MCIRDSRRGAERPGLDHVTADFQERTMDLGDGVGPGADEDLVATFELGPPEIVGGQPHELEVGAHGPVEDQHPLPQRLEVARCGRVETTEQFGGVRHDADQDTGDDRAPRTAATSIRPVPPRIYTKTGDDGTTGLYYGGRVRKDSTPIEINGAVDEAQAAIGLARAESAQGSELNERLTALERDLYILMAEVATAPQNRHKLKAGASMVTEQMVLGLEQQIDELRERPDIPSDFTVPGENRVAAALDFARTIVRRAERLAVTDPTEGSFVITYLNRLSDLLWAMARWQEGPDHKLSRRH